MAGGFRNEKGGQMYCDIMSFLETVKRKKLNIFLYFTVIISQKVSFLCKKFRMIRIV